MDEFGCRTERVKMEEFGNEEREETYDFDSETERDMVESDNELLEKTDEENEL